MVWSVYRKELRKCKEKLWSVVSYAFNFDNRAHPNDFLYFFICEGVCVDTPAASCAIVLPHRCVCIVAVMLHMGWRSRAKQRSNIWMDSGLFVSNVLSYGCGLPDLCPMMWSAHSAVQTVTVVMRCAGLNGDHCACCSSCMFAKWLCLMYCSNLIMHVLYYLYSLLVDWRVLRDLKHPSSAALRTSRCAACH